MVLVPLRCEVVYLSQRTLLLRSATGLTSETSTALSDPGGARPSGGVMRAHRRRTPYRTSRRACRMRVGMASSTGYASRSGAAKRCLATAAPPWGPSCLHWPGRRHKDVADAVVA